MARLELFIRLGLFVSAMVFSFSVQAAAIDSVITQATVYPQGALVTREASFSVSAGDNKVVIQGLPDGLEVEKTQIEIIDSQVTLGQVNMVVEQSRDTIDAEIASIQEQIAGNQNAIAVLDDLSKTADLQLKFLNSLSEGYAKEAWVRSAQANSNVASWQQALNLIQTGSSKAFELRRKNNLQKVELAKDASLLKRKLIAARGGRLSSQLLELNLASPSNRSVQVKIHYYQEDAGWGARYEARLNSDALNLRLSQKAVVLQHTEEDWSNIALTLSSSEPDQEIDSIELQSQFVDLYQPRPVAANRYQKKAAVADYSSSGRLEEIVVTAHKQARSWGGTYALDYKLPGLVSLSNNVDETQSFDLENYEFNVELLSQVAPRQNAAAYLAARFVQNQNLAIQPGALALYVDGSFMGETYLDSMKPGEEITLPMGRDRSVDVVVTQLGGENANKGVIKKQRVDTVNVQYEITNRRASPTLIEVLDIIPVSRNRAIKIAGIKGSTPPDEKDLNDKPGVVKWQKTLQQNDAWKIRHGYTTSYPADKRLTYK